MNHIRRIARRLRAHRHGAGAGARPCSPASDPAPGGMPGTPSSTHRSFRSPPTLFELSGLM